jgi:hypothetical protein
MSKEIVEGIILVLSCQKHLNTRLKEFKLPKTNYSGWRVIYVIGDFFLNEPYQIENDMLIVKCEDSYIHLLKKMSLSIKYLYENFDIKQGILRSGDDLTFNETNLDTFLQMQNKPDYYGQSPRGFNLVNPSLNNLKNTRDDYFMLQYYANHGEDFENPQHNLKNIDISKYIKRPCIDIGAAGVIYYLSNKACNILVEHMEKIDYNIFHFDQFSESYPYTIEDCGVSFIMYFNQINFINYKYFYTNRLNSLHEFISLHSNKYK